MTFRTLTLPETYNNRTHQNELQHLKRKFGPWPRVCTIPTFHQTKATGNSPFAKFPREFPGIFMNWHFCTHLFRALICVINLPLKRIFGSWETVSMSQYLRSYNWDYLFSTNLTVDSMWCAFRHVLDLAIDIVIKWNKYLPSSFASKQKWPSIHGLIKAYCQRGTCTFRTNAFKNFTL